MKSVAFHLFILGALSIGMGCAKAQNAQQYKQKLRGTNPAYQSNVVVSEHGVAATAISALQGRTAGGRVWGYRIRIFSDNSQNGRELATQALSRFKELFPDIPAPSAPAYESPYYKVTVGNCITEEEAIILLGRISPSFETAFRVQEEVALSSLGEAPLVGSISPDGQVVPLR